MANLRALQKENTRRRILEEALRLFQEQGYVPTTIDDIATAVGTTRVTFYAHFPNKSELMRALIGELNALLERNPSPQHGSTAAKLVDAVRIGTFEAIRPWLGAQAERWPLIKPYIVVSMEASAIDSEMRDLTLAWFDEVIGDMVDGMAQAHRFSPEDRAFRGYLAMELLNSTNLRWIREGWDFRSGIQLDTLALAWVNLLGAS
ncbi:MAG: helix-turn-helix domain containing protein [Microbacterium sp.]|uniref:TetR/AcrR family transcriptional regulator n=1 Tax=Microbacterium sp. TaxID=51671 RepID=UPI002632B3E6|nr:TetR/AcrR family transcriptional regulator [Microbacterium sp.]MCX6501787.1 helix-turn-helix domain containing protein [Microbacterium sp.]